MTLEFALEIEDYESLVIALERGYRHSQDLVRKGDHSDCLLQDMLTATILQRKVMLYLKDNTPSTKEVESDR